MIFDLKSLEICLGDQDENGLTINNDSYYLEPLYPGAKTGKGGNSCVFSALPQLPELPTLVVKFCRFPVAPINENYTVRIKRFRQEIKALVKAGRSEFSGFFVKLITAGEISLESFEDGQSKGEIKLLYYVMEQADTDLERFLSDNDLALNERVDLMERILDCMKAMHSLGYRHRDLKPDNVFLVNNLIKIGDLGLVDKAHFSYGLDSTREKIGPSGYLSPEAINKAFGDHQRISDSSRREITEESDIYQLGLIYFFILQGEVPVGRMEICDLETVKNFERWQESLFFPMMSFRKGKRPTLDEISTILQELK